MCLYHGWSIVRSKWGTLERGIIERSLSMHSIFPYNSSRSRWNNAFDVATVAAIGLATYGCFRLVRVYGWRGTLLYIWEGDPLPQDIRAHTNTLHEASNVLKKQEVIISLLEDGLHHARLNSSKELSPTTILRIWRMNMPQSKKDLRKILAMVSYELDALASKIDQVPSKIEVRNDKKRLSSEVVILMSRTDRLIEYFTLATGD